jgi:hypothetical protein
MEYPAGHIQEREEEKRQAIESLESAIASIEGQKRAPDKWERVCLVRAMSCIFSGAYELAAMEAHLATTPSEERSPHATVPSGRVYDFGLDVVKTALEEARNAPVEPYTRFGPTILRPANG